MWARKRGGQQTVWGKIMAYINMQYAYLRFKVLYKAPHFCALFSLKCQIVFDISIWRNLFICKGRQGAQGVQNQIFWTLTLTVSPCTYDNNRLDPPHPDLLLVNSIQQCRVNIMNIMPALCQPNSVRLLKIRSGITPHSPSPHSGSDAAFKSPSPVTVDQLF